jgi:fructosamine-3-kinase
MIRLIESVQRLIEVKTGREARIRSRTTAGGGCINHAEVLTLEDGRQFFLKSNARPLPGMFAREAEGLAALGAVGEVRVPGVIGWGGGGERALEHEHEREREREHEHGTQRIQTGVPYLLLEYIEQGRPGKGFFEAFGRGLARLHRGAQATRFGFEHDNYIGATQQPNGWSENWAAFCREKRLGFQLALARRNDLSDGAMNRCGERLLERLDELIGEPEEPACLLHGDLWGGNYLVDERGEAVLIDPAAYYGRREADLAMTFLFGGFDGRFYRAYEEVWPLAAGSGERLEIYKLYHLLNHLNLFGGGYYGSCMAILRRFG